VQVHGTGGSSIRGASCTEAELAVIISEEPPHGTGMDLTFSIKERSILLLLPFAAPSRLLQEVIASGKLLLATTKYCCLGSSSTATTTTKLQVMVFMNTACFGLDR
jgi:hypothetical protein